MITAQSFRFDIASGEAPADDLNDRDSLESAVQNHVEPLLSSTAPVIDGVEKLDAWIEHREIVVQELCPVGALETLYTERAALYLWRLNRVIGNENEAPLGGIEAGSEKKRADSPESRLNRTSPDRSKLQTLIKYEAHLNRCLASTMSELRRLQRERRQGFRFVNPGGRGADRAGVCLNNLDEKGSHGGSPSLKFSGAGMLIAGGRGADRAGICILLILYNKGSHGDYRSRFTLRDENPTNYRNSLRIHSQCVLCSRIDSRRAVTNNNTKKQDDAYRIEIGLRTGDSKMMMFSWIERRGDRRMNV